MQGVAGARQAVWNLLLQYPAYVEWDTNIKVGTSTTVNTTIHLGKPKKLFFLVSNQNGPNPPLGLSGHIFFGIFFRASKKVLFS